MEGNTNTRIRKIAFFYNSLKPNSANRRVRTSDDGLDIELFSRTKTLRKIQVEVTYECTP